MNANTSTLISTMVRHARRALVGLVIAVAGIAALPATEASAWTWSAGGVYGSVTPYTVFGQNVAKSSPGSYSTIPGVYIPGPVVSRAPYAGAQTVKYNLLIEQYWPSTNSWVNRVVDNVYVPTATLQPWQTSVRFADRYEQLGSGTFRVSYVVRWFNSYGSLIGVTHINFNQYGDYQCRILLCRAGTGWVSL